MSWHFTHSMQLMMIPSEDDDDEDDDVTLLYLHRLSGKMSPRWQVDCRRNFHRAMMGRLLQGAAETSMHAGLFIHGLLCSTPVDEWKIKQQWRV